MANADVFKEQFARAGVFEYGEVDTGDVEFSPEVRKMCGDNRCGKYGSTWACPPAVGTLEECRARVLRFEKLILFSQKYGLEDSLDYEGMMTALKDFKALVRKLDVEIQAVLSDYMILSAEGCALCESCAYPGGPCRFPDKAFGTIEGYGVWVSSLAKQAGINYINGLNTVTYFGALLHRKREDKPC